MPGKTSTTLAEAWKKYYASIEEARIALESTPRFQNNPEHRAQAYYGLAEAQAMAYNFAIAPRMDRPVIHAHTWYSYFYTLGGTSPDFYYGALFLDGKKTYRLKGRFGDLKLVLMQVFNYLMGHPESKMLSNVDFADFDIAPDGSFEAIASATKQEGNWIPLDPASDYNFIFLRRAIGDWYGDRGALDIQLLDKPAENDELSETALAKRLSLAADFLTFLVNKWNIGVYDMYLASNNGKKNTLCVVPGSVIASNYAGSPTTSYIFGVYEIEQDEAMIIECDVPDAGYWGFQVFDVWCKPFDFVHRQTDVNMHRVSVDGDGKYRAVLSFEDPGVANWLDPAGRKEGTLVGRNYHSKRDPGQPTVTLVKFSELHKHLPADTQLVSPHERVKALEYRQQGYAHLYGD